VVSFSTGRRDTRREALGEVQEFFRLFMVPGMQHCGGGPGRMLSAARSGCRRRRWTRSTIC